MENLLLLDVPILKHIRVLFPLIHSYDLQIMEKLT